MLPGQIRKILCQIIFGLGWMVLSGQAQEVTIEAGASQDFVAAAGAASYAWQLDGAALTNTGRTLTYAPANKEVGTHWVSVNTSWADGSRSNQNWRARVRISLPASGTNYYVATNGLDSNAGTLAAPFLTLERARNAVRTNGVPTNGVTIWVRGGVYWRTNTLELITSDSGKPGRPVVYRAYEIGRAHV